MNKTWKSNLLIALCFIAVIIVNSLANALPIGGITTGEASDLYPNLFTPAGMTFSIWGLIYLLLLSYVIYSFVRRTETQHEDYDLTPTVKTYFIITCFANVAWILAWHHQLVWLSLVFMLVLLISLIKIADHVNNRNLTRADQWLIRLPFSIYFGWISVATIANVTAFLVHWQWGGFGLSETFWTVVILVVGILIGISRMIKDNNVFYGMVFVWAYYGIWVKHTADSGFAGGFPQVITTLLVSLAVLGLAMIYLLFKTRRNSSSN